MQEGIGRKCLLRCVLGLVGLQFRLAFASGLGTAGRGKKLVVKFSAVEKIAKNSVCVDVSDLQVQTFLYA